MIKLTVMDTKEEEVSTDTFKNGLYRGEPYISGEQPAECAVKLNTNENPYPPSPGVLKALSEFDGGRLRLYPRQDGGKLRETLASYHGVSKENIFVANGSDEVLAIAFRACFGTDKPVLFSEVTYSFYPVWCEFLKIPFETVSASGGFRHEAEDFLKPNGGIVICEPNAPTGIAQGEKFIDRVLELNGDRSVVIVDEAYGDFAEFSAIPKTINNPNLLVTRTFSKGRSLAGLRIGYAIGDKILIDALMAAKDSFNSYPIDSLSEALGVISIEDEEYYRATTEKIKRTRGETEARLKALGFDVPESSANFIFAGAGSEERAKEILGFLREAGIYVRHFDKPDIKDRLRISIGKPEDMEILFRRLEEYLAL